jgi:threonine dehydratase
MPENAPAVKKAAVKSYGADIFYCEANEQAREAALKNVVKQTGATFIHPFNNYRVIEGQATAALEMLHDVSSLEAIIAPVGGGGLLSGTALAASYAATGIKVFGAEPQAADDAWQSLQEGRIIPANNPETIADGLRTSLGELTFAIIAKSVETIITVSEEEIIQAMRLIWERAKLVVEPSAAVALAAVTSSRHKIDAGSIGLIISGGNVDLDNLPW